MSLPEFPVAPVHNLDIILLVLYVLLALVFSFLCSIAESVLLSVTPSYIEDLITKKKRLGIILKRLKMERVDESLSAILTLNTIAHTVGAIGSGAKATAVFGSAWFGAFSAVMTVLILFLSEILPKTIGTIYWKHLSWPTALFVRFLVFCLYPLVWLSSKFSSLFASGSHLHVFSRDEFVAMARMGERSGQLNKEESNIIQNLVAFDSVPLKKILTPRTVVAALPEDTPLKEAFEYIRRNNFSRIPVYRGNLDCVTGYVLRSEVYRHHANRETGRILELRRDIITVTSFAKPSVLMEKMFREKEHTSVVVDEYGGTMGIVTLEDLFETLLGREIVDETDKVEDMQKLARERKQG